MTSIFQDVVVFVAGVWAVFATALLMALLVRQRRVLRRAPPPECRPIPAVRRQVNIQPNPLDVEVTNGSGR